LWWNVSLCRPIIKCINCKIWKMDLCRLTTIIVTFQWSSTFRTWHFIFRDDNWKTFVESIEIVHFLNVSPMNKYYENVSKFRDETLQNGGQCYEYIHSCLLNL
jgi:hypothetical protein